MSIDRTAPRPAYQQIADDLRADIDSGAFAAGSLLPSERTLTARYGASPTTVRPAIALLKNEGRVVAERGRGVFVRKVVKVRRSGTTRYLRGDRRPGTAPLEAEAETQGLSRETRVLEVRSAMAPPAVAELLRQPPGTEVVVRRHLLLLDGEPAQLADSYFPARIATGTRLEEPQAFAGGVHAYLEDELHHELDHFDEVIDVRMPTPDQVRALRLLPGVPVVKLVRTLYTTDGIPVEVSDFTLAGDRITLTYTVPAH